jgi:hypothetical protein
VQGIANTRAKQARERALNRVLPPLQAEFERRLGTKDELVKLTDAHREFIERILAEELDTVLLG